MIIKMSETMISQLGKDSIEAQNRKNEVKDYKNLLYYRQSELWRVIKKGVTPHNSFGFSCVSENYSILSSTTKNGMVFSLNTKEYKISLKNRNLEYRFTPVMDSFSGIFRYNFSRFENGYESAIRGELSWSLKDRCWFLNYHGKALETGCFNDKGVTMILANLAYM